MPSSRHSGAPGSPFTGASSPKAMTSERIAADIAAFNKAGGRIEVLGNTPLHGKSAVAASTANSASVTASERASDPK